MTTAKHINKLIITGSLSWDIIMDFPSRFVDYLQKDKLHQINVSFVVDKLEKQLGGTATNIAYNASLLTREKIILLGALGKDGNEHLRFFKRHHIDASHILHDNSLYCATGSAITDIKDNQIWGFYYGACAKGRNIRYRSYFSTDALLIISANHPDAFLAAQRSAITSKISYVYDPGMALSWIKNKDLRQGVNNCRYLIGNDYEMSMIEKILKTSVRALVKKGITAIVTLGEKGVNYFDKQNSLHVSGYKKTKAVDPTGAGDAWRGAFMASVIEKRSLEESLRVSNALASFAVEKYGTANHLPSIKAMHERAQTLTVKNISL